MNQAHVPHEHRTREPLALLSLVRPHARPLGKLGRIALAIVALVGCGDKAPSRSIAREDVLPIDLRLGGEDEGAQGFSDLRAIAVDARGRIYAADIAEREVRVFERDGSFVRTIGRYGRGPGEFIEPRGLAIGPDEHLFVQDPLQHRVSEFDSSGALIASHRVEVISRDPVWEGGIDGKGRLVDRQQVLRTDTIVEWEIRRHLFSDSTMERFPYTTCGYSEGGFRHRSGFGAVPFAAGRLLWIDPSRGTWCAATDRATLYFVPLGERAPRDSVVTDFEPARVTAAEADSAVAALIKQLPFLDRDAIRLEVPSTKPGLRGVTASEDGSVWVWIHDARGNAIDEFAPDRTWRARHRITVQPSTGRQLVVRGRAIHVIGRDSLDVPLIYRFVAP